MSRAVMLMAVVAAVGALPAPAAAQLEFGNEAPRVFSIQERPYRLGHEFQLGFGVLPLDAFYVGAVANASYTYHFSDFWAWEIAGGGYSRNFGTGLEDRLFDDYGVVPTQGGGEQIHGFLATSLVIKPLFGKLALFNSSIVYGETFFVGGVGSVRKGEHWRPALDFGIGFRLWSGHALSWRLDIRDYLVFARSADEGSFKRFLPENALLLGLSASFNYFVDDEREEAR